jgi:hypothetical protein
MKLKNSEFKKLEQTDEELRSKVLTPDFTTRMVYI